VRLANAHHAPTRTPQAPIANIRSFLEKMTTAIVKHGGLKGKRLTECAAAVAAHEPETAAVGGRTRIAGISSLAAGPDPGSYIVLRPLMPISKRDEPPA